MEDKKVKILIVDDDKTIIKIVSFYLEKEGYEVLTAENGEQAYNIAVEQLPTVIISDIMMPVMDGYELCKKIKENEELKYIPVLLLTAKESKSDIIKGFECGANDFITKPFHSVELLARIKSFVNLRLNHLEIIEKNKIIENSQKELETIFNNINESIFIFNKNLEIIRINKIAEQLLGKPKSQILKKAYLEVFNIEYPDNNDIILLSIEEEKNFLNKEAKLITEKEQEIPVLINTSFIKLDNEDFILIVVIFDITELKKVENMKNEFLSIISHELRTPLASIKASAETLYLCNDIDIETTKQFSKIINDEADRLTRLINEILDLAKIESKKMTYNFTVIEINRIIINVINLFEKYANQKNIKLHYSLPDKTLYLYGDPDRIHQIISNLLSNAIKFTEPEKNIYVNLKYDDTFIILEIRDEGVGIPKNELKKIFNKFYQVSNSLTRKENGTGLGLSLVKAFVEAHKGIINVDSELGKGSTFTIKIPLYNDTEEIINIEVKDNFKNNNILNILVVDDSIEFLNSLKKTLETEGFNVYKALDGIQALDILNKKKIDILLLDLKLPNMNGYEVIKNIRAQNSNLPIVVITASDLGRSQKRVLQLGANEYMQKPFSINEFKEKLKKLSFKL
ncbi:MAG TPA: response regulator [bacterium]|nr:response regulator [bacterium]